MVSEGREVFILPEKGNKKTKIVQNSRDNLKHYKTQLMSELKAEQDPTNNNNDLNAVLTRIESKVDSFITMCTGIAQAQTILAQNQEVILSKLSDFSAKLDGFAESRSPQTEGETLNRRLIDNEESLNEFENSLKDSKFVDEMTKTYSIVCGKEKGRAINNAYALIDAMFDRTFLTKCSWSGGSRTDETKVCFKFYKRVINFFFHIIHQSDKQFTMLECEAFLKNILRNAKKRSDAKMLKTSSQKCRPKRHNNSMENVLVFLNEESGTANQELDSDSVNEESGWEINE